MNADMLNTTADARYLVLPAVPASASLALQTATAGYLAVFLAPADPTAPDADAAGDRWNDWAKAISDHESASLVDVAVKLLFATHYNQPDHIDGVAAIDLAAFDADTGRMFVRCAADLLRMTEREGR